MGRLRSLRWGEVWAARPDGPPPGRALRTIVVLFAVMVVVCVATVVSAGIRIAATGRAAAGAERDLAGVRDELTGVRADLTESEQRGASSAAKTVTVTRESVAAALGGIDAATFDLPITICVADDDCPDRQTVTVTLVGCDGFPCVMVPDWGVTDPVRLELGGLEWRADGGLSTDKLSCAGDRLPATWTLRATVAEARYSVSGGWTPVRITATFDVDSTDEPTDCDYTGMRWTTEVAL
ncbi:hypothetical protein Q0Z83_022200 [Actinoplanes sichuanensis]|uniref:Uncharacterized protein n=1 Tax=Actinoplanes sichuanensis TaxID=512349 RepID=A0ABW4AJY1_9ACTN|nr:hypothetical protein [Actinoplanes sichuanensis]BEL04029.1 hypothetical protein Q0Z83_022200 [Actinoplanes sichuanensis]